MSKLNVNRVRDLLQEFAFQDLFVEELGWNNPGTRRAESLTVGDENFTYRGVAILGGIEAFEVKGASGVIPSRATQLAISKEIAKVRFEHVLIFVDEKRTQSVWFWVKRDGNKRFPREHHFFKGQPGDLFISKIASMSVDLSELDDSGQLPLLEAAKKVQRALDIERVIKKFFKDYDDQRVEFTKLIKGIPDDKDRRWYASVLLNRLMFIYFLQRKFFIDGGDELYLENKLRQSKSRGLNRFYGEFLQALFFEAFAKPEEKRTKEARQLTGKVKYLNGGLFLPHRLEQRYQIAVPDEAFDELFKLFGRYSWNLNDVPGESDDDINPDVLGYIFEKYINQKEFGAYYTRPEITEYLCEQTIYKLILDRTSEPDVEGLPQGRTYESVPELLVRLDKQTARKLLHDILPDLTILDPAVGSGAFLVAALKTLITVYSAVIGWLKFHDDAWLDEHLRTKMKTDLTRVQYAIKKAIITDNLYGVDLMEEATEIAKLRLFMTLVASAHTVDDLEPLPNIDFNILAGNSLIGLMRVEDAEFEAKQIKQASLFAPTKTYRQILDERNRKVDQYRHASGYVDDLAFMRDGVQEIEQEARPILAALLEQRFSDLGVKFEQATWDEKKWEEGKPIKRAVTVEDIDNPTDPDEGLKPFHWGFEFDRILHLRGGFDAIITNPPWETLKPISREFCYEHSPEANRRLSTAKEFDALLKQLLRDDEIRASYLKYLSGFPHQSSYFRAASEYSNQSAVVGGKKTGTDVNLYKLFVERSYRLLRKGGLCGIVIPSGIYSDLGTTGLRRLLFTQSKVTGIFCFENRKEIFEGVHRSFKFVVLSYQKGGETDAFPAAFMRLDVSDLSRFPESIGMTITLDTVKSLSPETLSVVEFQHPLDAKIAADMLRFPMLGDEVEGAWQLKLTREFDMTNDAALFESSPSSDKRILYEGKMIWHFTHQYADARYWVKESIGRKSVLGRTQDTGQLLDYQRYRFAHRSITGNTNERTMVCSILPKNVFYGHSLNASKRNGVALSDSELLFLDALMSSFVVDYSLRQRVATQLTMFFVYQLPVPRLTKKDSAFAPIVRRAARLVCTTPDFADLWNEVDADIGLQPNNSSPKLKATPWNVSLVATASHDRAILRAELDGLVACLYELTEEEFRHVLSTFPLVDPAVKDAALAAFRSVQAGRIQ
ncbi:MAG: ATP-binding protein [Armatimonadetes bacterium]|nr:ATP-binding protein [Armatimonadota bacterium]